MILGFRRKLKGDSALIFTPQNAHREKKNEFHFRNTLKVAVSHSIVKKRLIEKVTLK